MTDEDEGGIDRKQAALLVMLGVAIALTPVLVYGALSYTWEAGSGITFEQTDGPSVELGTGVETDSENPFPDDHTVDLSPQGTFHSNNSTYVRVDNWGSDSTWTQLSDINASEAALTADIENRERIVIDGDATAVSYHSIGVGEGHVMTVEHADGGQTQMTVGGFSDSDRVAVIDADTGAILEATDVNSDGEITFATDGSRDLKFESGATVDLSVTDASPTGDLSSAPTELSVDVSSSIDDEISVDFTLNGETIGSETVSGGSGTASVSIDSSDTVSGTNTWEVTATDSLNQTVSESHSFQVPDELRIYNESDPDQLVTDDVNVEITFFGSDDTVERRTVSNGTVDMSGLPVDEEYTIQVEADGYITRQTIIRSLYEQQSAFLLPENAETVTSRFELDDPTGQFDQDSTRILIQKPVDRNGSTTYETVVGDVFGTGEFSTVLERDQRYLIEVEDMDSGRIRELGPYVATASENVVLEVDQLDYEFEDEDVGYRWNASYVEGSDAIDFVYDTDRGFDELEVKIVERGGDTVIASETWTNGESIQERFPVPDEVQNPNATTYRVEWSATVTDPDGEMSDVNGSTVIGPGLGDPTEGIGDRVLELVAILIILLVAGLFSAANVGIGGVVTSLTAGLFWMLGVLPGVVSGIMIVVALMLSVLWMVRNARGPQ
ncbi:hypothetical protein [Natrinema sp. CGMCC1.2065]|uniref:hypothetical protein n=1 Tax=Natrinema sp. CGMCC1.2065 TaxID=3445767 RepID=UPI003F49E6E7